MFGNPHQLVAEELDSSWIRDKSLWTPFIYVFLQTGEALFVDVDSQSGEDWEVCLPTVGCRIFSRYMENMIPIYEVVFEEMGFRLPLSDF